MDFLIILEYYVDFSLNIVFLLVGIFLPLFVIFVGGVCLSLYYTCFLSVYFGCAGTVGVFLACRVVFSAWGSAVWSVGPVQFIGALVWSGWRDCTGFSSLALL